MGRQNLIYLSCPGGSAYFTCGHPLYAGSSHFNVTPSTLPLIDIIWIQDLSSYIIARTLGVVDAVKASTNDKPVFPVTRIKPPSILIEDMSTLTPDLTDSTHAAGIPVSPSDSITSTDEEPGGLAAFASLDASMFSNDKLSGVGVFSPASSRPSSPTLSRRKLKESMSPRAELNVLPEVEELSLRKRVRHGRAENGGV